MKIKQLKALDYGTPVEGVYVFVNPSLKLTRGGKDFLSCILQDNSGQITGVQWEISDKALYEYYLQKFQVFKVRGRLENYRDALQVLIQELSPVESIPREMMRELLPSLSENEINESLKSIKKLGKNLQHPACIELFQRMFQDKVFLEYFTRAPAAVMVHHAYCGGLIQHTACVMQHAWQLHQMYNKQYSQLNSDIVLLGALFHDLGKIEEIQTGPRFENTDEGKLLGHTMISLEMFSRLAASIENFPHALVTAVKHCIISHHGLAEWGAAVVPRTIEAEIVFLADYTDSTLRQFIESVQADNMKEWSDYNRFLERSVFSSAYDTLPSRGGLWKSKLFSEKSPSRNESAKNDHDKKSPDFKKHPLF